LAVDCVLSGTARGDGAFDCEGLTIQEGTLEALDLENCRLSNLTLQWCEVHTLTLPDYAPENVRLVGCLIDRVNGAGDARGLPPWVEKCEVAEFDQAQTNAAILRLAIPLPVKVLLTILRKLFVQRGSGRRESALHRGLDQQCAKLVKPILEIVRTEGIAYCSPSSSGPIWHGNRVHRKRIFTLLSSPRTNTDPLMAYVNKLEQ
jgi:hypothetical protein